MYTIEYNEIKKEIPDIPTTFFIGDGQRITLIGGINGLRRTHRIRLACLNIKSLTIDYEDIEAIMETKSNTTDAFFGILARASRSKEKIDKVVIYNDSQSGAHMIYDIINTKWLINKDEFKYSEELENLLVSEVYEAMKLKYEGGVSRFQQDRRNLNYKMKYRQLEHYMIQVDKYKNNIEQSRDESIKIMNIKKEHKNRRK